MVRIPLLRQVDGVEARGNWGKSKEMGSSNERQLKLGGSCTHVCSVSLMCWPKQMTQNSKLLEATKPSQFCGRTSFNS